MREGETEPETKTFANRQANGKKIAHNINANAKKLSENSKNGIKEEEKKKPRDLMK